MFQKMFFVYAAVLASLCFTGLANACNYNKQVAVANVQAYHAVQNVAVINAIPVVQVVPTVQAVAVATPVVQVVQKQVFVPFVVHNAVQQVKVVRNFAVVKGY
jgi:hypothetical protein